MIGIHMLGRNFKDCRGFLVAPNITDRQIRLAPQRFAFMPA